jgi:polysaccharide biosynthesis/export protein
VDGDILKPGSYPYTQGITVRDLVFAAGNILESAYLDQAEITSQIVEGDRTVKLVHRDINLRSALEGDAAHNVALNPYDRLTVRKLQDWGKRPVVTVNGEIRFPGRYVARKKEKLTDLIQRAGGFTDDAYLRGAVFTRIRVKEMQQKSLDEMIARMERELLAEGATVTAVSSEAIQSRQVELQQRQKFVEALKKVEPSGRMTIRLANLRLLKGSEYDIDLEDGDSLFIPTRNDVVNVAGAVMSNGSFVHKPAFKYEDYIHMAGGYSRYSDTDNVFVVKVDGSARKLSSSYTSWNPFKKRWQLEAFGEERAGIEAGDSIIVPEKLERTAWLRELKDITQIVANVGMTAANIALLFRVL